MTFDPLEGRENTSRGLGSYMLQHNSGAPNRCNDLFRIYNSSNPELIVHCRITVSIFCPLERNTMASQVASGRQHNLKFI